MDYLAVQLEEGTLASHSRVPGLILSSVAASASSSLLNVCPWSQRVMAKTAESCGCWPSPRCCAHLQGETECKISASLSQSLHFKEK